MVHFVTEKCIKCKYTDCVEVCPVDCFFEGDEMLVIDPEQCIDCGVCIPECPIDAITTDDAIRNILENEDDVLNEEQKNLKALYYFNAEYSKIWKNITCKKTPDDLEKAKEAEYEKNKYQYLIEKLQKE